MKKFSGATIRDMHSYTIPTIEKKPNLIVLHVGTNDLPSRRGEEEKSEVQIAQEIIELANEMKENNIEVIISGLVPRGDDYEEKEEQSISFLLIFAQRMIMHLLNMIISTQGNILTVVVYI